MAESNRLPRKLAAILYADVAEYSRLTGEDEDATHRTLSEYLDLVAGTVTTHNGTVVHYAGDAVLADFPSAFDAVSCATEVQRGIEARNQTVAEERRVRFRIGVNLGDVIVDRDDIYGDGVNVAARLEGLADAGGICVSESVRGAVGNRLPLVYEDLGEQSVKNIAEPIRAYRVVLDGDEVPKGTVRPSRPPLPRVQRPILVTGMVLAPCVLLAIVVWLPWRPAGLIGPLDDAAAPAPGLRTPDADAGAAPSIAVLPFDNMSDDPEQEYFSDGLTEDLITEISRISGLRVIARHSSFAFKDSGGGIQEIGRTLGARYLVEGSVRKSGDRLRINAQLISTRNGTHLWAERYDRMLTDVFELQDELTRTIASALAVTLTLEEERLLNRVRKVDPDAYDTLLRGLAHLRRYTAEDNVIAREFFTDAIAVDPDYARAYAGLALTHQRDFQSRWSEDAEESYRLGLSALDRAEKLDENLPLVHFVRSGMDLVKRRFEGAESSARRAIALDPNYADGYGVLAWALAYAGRPSEALPAIRRAKRLNPLYPFEYLWVEALPLFMLGNYREAAANLREALDRNPAFVPARLLLVATYGHLGEAEAAAWELEELRTLQEHSLATVRDGSLYQQPEDLERLLEGLRLAGLRE